MISLPEMVAFAMLVSLAFYTLLGGADFGGGVWDLLASGPRAADQRHLVEKAIAPVWEANHVWLILVVVLLFTAFPTAYAAASIALFAPLSFVLVGIVLRGAGFVFRSYGSGPAPGRRRWGWVFAAASTITPVFLGVILAAITAGEIRLVDGVPTSASASAWLGPFPLLVGLFVLCLFAFLAAVYLTNEAPDRALQEDFRVRALASGLALGAVAWAAKLSAGPGTSRFGAALSGSWWSWPLQIATGAVAVLALLALYRRRYRLARAAAIVQVVAIVSGWGLGQRPFLIAPDLTIDGAAAPEVTLKLTLGALALGSVVLFPSLAWMFRVFKASRGTAQR